MSKTLKHLNQAECWVFDLDNTLYPADCQLFPQIEQLMSQFVSKFLDLDLVAARAKQKEYFYQYGTTLRGLMVQDGVDPHAFLQFVHAIDYSILSYDSHLDKALTRMQARKIIFTNGSVEHAEHALQQLGLRHHFEAIFDIVAADFQPKPQAQAYQKLFDEHAIQADKAVMVEDIAKNLEFPHACGMATLWIENNHEWCQADSDEHIHFSTADLANFLHEVLDYDSDSDSH